MEGSNINGIELFVPQTFRGILPTSPNREYFEYEIYAYSGLKMVVSPEDTVFDIGASWGVMSCLISKLCGTGGKVFAFEANSTPIKNARLLANANDTKNINFINKFVGEKSGAKEFYIIQGFKSTASTANPEALKWYSHAMPTIVSAVAIDDFAKETGVVPNVCKIDVEGSEYLVISGMQDLLSKYDIDLVIETHGEDIPFIGGDLNLLLEKLQKFGYNMINLITRTPTNRKEYCEQYHEGHGHILLSKDVKDSLTKS